MLSDKLRSVEQVLRQAGNRGGMTAQECTALARRVELARQDAEQYQEHAIGLPCDTPPESNVVDMAERRAKT